MSQVICLADFFNLGFWDKGQQPTFADVRDGLSDLVAATLSAVTERDFSPAEVVIRLYGGWYGETVDERIPLRELSAAAIGAFRTSGRPRIRIQLAEAPIWNPSLRLLRTVRTVRLRSPGGTIQVPTGCHLGESCNAIALAEWWRRGKCPAPGCRSKLDELGSMTRQKMVDTHLTADALWVMHERSSDILLLASDDDDMIPALLSALSFGIPAIRLRRSGRNSDYYDGIFEVGGLTTHSW